MTAKSQNLNTRWYQKYRWTLALCAVMAVANAGLFINAGLLEQCIDGLQFDRQAILDGQIWRLVTGSLVHWSQEHFLLDVGAFALVGMLYEPRLGRAYPWVILSAGMAVGLGILFFLPDMAIYRGLSGVDSGQFAAALAVECRAATDNPRHWIWLAPVTGIFIAKIAFELTCGQMFFGTESLGDIGLPTPLAHAAGALFGGVTILVAYCWRTTKFTHKLVWHAANGIALETHSALSRCSRISCSSSAIRSTRRA